MNAKVNSAGRLIGLACVVGWLTLQSPAALLNAKAEYRAVPSSALMAANPAVRSKLSEAYGRVPLSFEANVGQADRRVKFLSRGNGYNLFLTSTEATFAFSKTKRVSPKNVSQGSARKQNPGGPAERVYSPSRISDNKAAALRISLLGADKAAKVEAADELPGKNNYFIGSDSKKWRTNVPAYSRVKCESIYAGVDLVFYGNQRQLEYDFIVAPGVSFKSIRMAFEGAYRIRLNESGDLLIETSVGEIRQRKPIIYQETRGAKQPVRGGYVLRGEMEVGFEVADYDTSRTLVIDPLFVYSTSIGGSINDNATAVAVDAEGNAYITGITDSFDFPTVNAVQPLLNQNQISLSDPTDAFVMKLNPSGTALLYSTFLGGGDSDGANAIAIDSAGNAYVTGLAASKDFPTTPGAFQTKPSTGGDAFITKLNPAGNALVYSTYLGGSGNVPPASQTVTTGRGLAVDAEGSAYVTGYTFSPSFPTKKAAQGQFNRGATLPCCFACLYNFAPGPSPLEDAFVTKLNPSGTGLVYSTYLGGSGQDEAFAIAVDSLKNAYVTGRTCSRDFGNAPYGGGFSDAFVVKLSSSGRQFEYSSLLSGSGDDTGNGIVVDSAGSAYVTGQTDSVNFPSTQRAFQQGLGGSVAYATADGGSRWSPRAGLPNSSVKAVAIDPTNPSTIYAGLGDCSTRATGIFKSTDGGETWRSAGLGGQIIEAIAIDPKQSSTVYAGRNKSTDGGGTWIQIILDFAISELKIDPVTPTTLYSITNGLQCGDAITLGFFRKSTDGGRTWSSVRNGPFFFNPNSIVFDPQNSATLYAITDDGNLFESTDSGNSWRIPYSGSRSFHRFAIDRANSSTFYLSDRNRNIFKSTDRGRTFTAIGSISGPINQLLVDPMNSSTLYAAVGIAELIRGDFESTVGLSGGVFKSTDAGQTWNATDLIGMTINTLAIDSLNSSRVYAGAHFDTDGFIAKINAEGGALVYSTYLGTRSPESARGIAIDEARNAYVTGGTFSDRFPRIDALQMNPNGPFDTATFTAKLSATGSALLFSSYIGGTDPSFGSGIAVDAAGKIVVVGTAGTRRPTRAAETVESVHGGLDAFVIRIVSPPRITAAAVSGKNLIVAGEGFDKGAVIIVDGVEQRTRNNVPSPATILIGKKAAKDIAPGQRVNIQVRNSDGLRSESFGFTRLP